MKTKILSIVLLVIFSFLSISQAGAQPTESQNQENQSQDNGEQKTKNVRVSEKIPGGNCKCVVDDISSPGGLKEISEAECAVKKPYERKYVCSHEKGVAGFQKFFSSVVNWIVQISVILGVLAFAALGIAWMIQDVDNEESKKFLKGWIVNLIIGLIILFTFKYILQFFGWIY